VLDNSRHRDADREPEHEREQAEKRHVVSPDVQQWFLEDAEIHVR
jgi:hypothetical protein